MKGISLGLALICGTLFAVAIHCAERLTSQEVRHYEIREGVVMDQLTSWSLTANIQVGCSLDNDTDTAARVSRRGRALVGDYTPLQALQLLMKAHGLQYQEVNPYTLYVKASDQQPDPKWLAEDKKAGKAETPKPLVVTLPAALNDSVVVTGSRLDYRRDEVATVANTLTIFDSDRIEELGVSTVGELLKYTPQQPYGPRPAFATEKASQVPEMRGLGFDTTLVLIDGRRTFITANTIASNTFDLEALPITAIERVEILSESASAVYGADAVGGVVNVITKKHITSPLVSLHAGWAKDGAAERRASLSTGLQFGKIGAVFAFDTFERDHLFGAERDRWRNQDFTKLGGQDWRVGTGNPGNIRSLTSQNLPGLPSRIAAVPARNDGLELDISDFEATAGVTNLSSPYRYWSAVPAASRHSATLSLTAPLSGSTNMFIDLMYFSRVSEQQSEPIAKTLIIPASNYFNPFDAAVAVDYSFAGIGPQLRKVKSDLARLTSGLQGNLGDWRWEATGVHSHDAGFSRTYNQIDDSVLGHVLSSDDQSQALNVFTAGPGGSSELLSSIRKTVDSGAYESDGDQLSAFIQGPLISLPTGPVHALLGAERVSSSVSFKETNLFKRERSASALYTELSVPLLGSLIDENSFSDVVLEFAARYDSYSDSGDTFNRRIGLKWQPRDGLDIYGSHSTSFRPPSLFELGIPVIEARSVVAIDPMRNDEIVNIDFRTGGNPNLKPLTASTLNAGIAFNSLTPNSFQFRVTFWRVELNNRVSVLPYLRLLPVADQFPGRVVRADQTEEDAAKGRPGKLLSVDITRINFGQIMTRGLDFSAAHSIPSTFGEFSLMGSATWVDQFNIEDIPGMPARERVAIADISGSIARWRAIATLSWNRNGAGISLTSRYTSGYMDLNFRSTPTGQIVKSQTVFDLHASMEIDSLFQDTHLARGTTFSAGVTNLLNKAPSFSNLGAAGFDVTQGDLRMRFVYFRFGKSF